MGDSALVPAKEKLFLKRGLEGAVPAAEGGGSAVLVPTEEKGGPRRVLSPERSEEEGLAWPPRQLAQSAPIPVGGVLQP